MTGDNAGDSNHADRNGLLNGDSANYRVVQVEIEWHGDDRKPVHMKKRVPDQKSSFLEHFYDCDNLRDILMYKPGFKGTLRRKILISKG